MPPDNEERPDAVRIEAAAFRAQFDAIRAEFAVRFAAGEPYVGDEGTRRYMRELHDELIALLNWLGERWNG